MSGIYDSFREKLGKECVEKQDMNTAFPRPVSALTGQLSRNWHRDSRPAFTPSVDEDESWKAALPPSDFNGNGRRILLVDDEPAIRDVTKLLLERRGFEVVTAKDGVTGLLAFTANPNFAAVISDLRMPRADGRIFISSLRAHSPIESLPIICMTGVLTGGQDTEEFKEQMGINTVLQKPFTEAALLASLERELAQIG